MTLPVMRYDAGILALANPGENCSSQHTHRHSRHIILF